MSEKHIWCGHKFRLPHVFYLRWGRGLCFSGPLSEAVSFPPGPRAPVKTETGEDFRKDRIYYYLFFLCLFGNSWYVKSGAHRGLLVKFFFFFFFFFLKPFGREIRHTRPQRPRSFYSAPCQEFYRGCAEQPFLILSQSEYQTWLSVLALAEWREVRESRTSDIGPSQDPSQRFQRSRFLVLTNSSAASENERLRS